MKEGEGWGSGRKMVGEGRKERRNGVGRTGTVAGEEEVEDAIAEELHWVSLQTETVEMTEATLTLVELAEVALLWSTVVSEGREERNGKTDAPFREQSSRESRKLAR
jgi:hypothetical protein